MCSVSPDTTHFHALHLDEISSGHKDRNRRLYTLHAGYKQLRLYTCYIQDTNNYGCIHAAYRI